MAIQWYRVEGVDGHMQQRTYHRPERELRAIPVILVVDDDAALSRMLLLALRGDGLDVASAPNGQVALDEVEERHPDVIVLDLEMPVMDGRTFYRELRARGTDTPVLILSAFEARRGQRELGANAYLNKPFDPDDLVREVRQLLPTCAA